MPFWADGGAGSADPVLAPGRHVLAAMPSRIERATLADLARACEPPSHHAAAHGAAGLESWLRPRLAGSGRTPLHVVGLTYEAGFFASTLADGLADLRPRPLPHDAVVIATYPGYLLGASEHGPWEAVGDCGPLFEALSEPPAAALPCPPVALADLSAQPPQHAQAAHEAAVRAIKEGIANGDYYQVNLARRLEGPCPSRAAPAIHAALRRAQPTAFAALWAFDEGRWLVSGSPECLFHYDGATRAVSTFPIKGTAPRSPDPEADAALAAALFASEKDQAEHLMIVDLERNDLGRLAVTGSVHVPRLFAELPLTTLRHLVSEVACTLGPGCDLAALVGALFPGGSITGAPKIAAMRAIAAHEPFARGFYCGSLGLVMGEAEAVFSILIRTAVLADGELVYCTGGGLVADSDPEAEWRETELKASALLRALRPA